MVTKSNRQYITRKMDRTRRSLRTRCFDGRFDGRHDTRARAVSMDAETPRRMPRTLPLSKNTSWPGGEPPSDVTTLHRAPLAYQECLFSWRNGASNVSPPLPIDSVAECGRRRECLDRQIGPRLDPYVEPILLVTGPPSGSPTYSMSPSTPSPSAFPSGSPTASTFQSGSPAASLAPIGDGGDGPI